MIITGFRFCNLTHKGLTAMWGGRGVGSFQKYQVGFACERSVMVACLFQRLNWVGLLASSWAFFFQTYRVQNPITGASGEGMHFAWRLWFTMSYVSCVYRRQSLSETLIIIIIIITIIIIIILLFLSSSRLIRIHLYKTMYQEVIFYLSIKNFPKLTEPEFELLRSYQGHLFIYQARWIHSKFFYPILLQFILISYSCLRVGNRNSFSTSGFPTKIPCAFYSRRMCHQRQTSRPNLRGQPNVMW